MTPSHIKVQAGLLRPPNSVSGRRENSTLPLSARLSIPILGNSAFHWQRSLRPQPLGDTAYARGSASVCLKSRRLLAANRAHHGRVDEGFNRRR